MSKSKIFLSLFLCVTLLPLSLTTHAEESETISDAIVRNGYVEVPIVIVNNNTNVVEPDSDSDIIESWIINSLEIYDSSYYNYPEQGYIYAPKQIIEYTKESSDYEYSQIISLPYGERSDQYYTFHNNDVIAGTVYTVHNSIIFTSANVNNDCMAEDIVVSWFENGQENGCAYWAWFNHLDFSSFKTTGITMYFSGLNLIITDGTTSHSYQGTHDY